MLPCKAFKAVLFAVGLQKISGKSKQEAVITLCLLRIRSLFIGQSFGKTLLGGAACSMEAVRKSIWIQLGHTWCSCDSWPVSQGVITHLMVWVSSLSWWISWFLINLDKAVFPAVTLGKKAHLDFSPPYLLWFQFLCCSSCTGRLQCPCYLWLLLILRG